MIASFELVLIIASLFAFSYIVHESEGIFEELDDAFEEARGEKEEQIASIEIVKLPQKKSFLMTIIDYLKKPIIPMVSAQVTETIIGYDVWGNPIILTEESIVTTFEFSGDAAAGGCCSVATNGLKCATTTADNCAAGSSFAEGALCTQTSFCQ